MKTKNKLSVGDEVKFHSGNYEGLTGVITEAKYNVPDTLYGLKFTVKLSNGQIGSIEKSEHWHFI
jgi:transcription antitermination factor NusG